MSTSSLLRKCITKLSSLCPFTLCHSSCETPIQDQFSHWVPSPLTSLRIHSWYCSFCSFSLSLSPPHLRLFLSARKHAVKFHISKTNSFLDLVLVSSYPPDSNPLTVSPPSPPVSKWQSSCFCSQMSLKRLIAKHSGLWSPFFVVSQLHRT